MSQTLETQTSEASPTPSGAAARRLHVISHTHWDREWYLSHENFRLLLVDLIDRLLVIMNQNKEFRYFHLDGQTIVLEDYLEIRPYMRPQLEALIKSGRILIGPWYLQNDEYLTDGESTVRNLLLGFKICRRDYGVEPMMVGYVPDQFGNISQLPQILNGFGIQSAVFGRGYNEPTGPQEFLWRSPDGSEVLSSYLITWYNNAQRLPRDPQQALAMLQELITNEAQRPQTENRLLMNGVDHLEAQENISEIIRDVNALEPGFELIHSTLPAYFDSLRATLESPRVLKGEMRAGDNGAVLPGTASSRIHLKQANFECQQTLRRWVEPLAVFASLIRSPYQAAAPIDYAWKLLIQNHPHDSICGCSIDEVHFQMEARFHRVQDVLRDQLGRSMRYITACIDTQDRPHHSILNLFNVHPQPETSVLETVVETLDSENIADFELVSESGEPVPYELLGSSLVITRILNPKRLPKLLKVWRHRMVIEAENVPACGYKALFLRRKAGRAQSAMDKPAGEMRTVLQSYGYTDDPTQADSNGKSADGAASPAKSVKATKTSSPKGRRSRKLKGQQIPDAGIELRNEFLSARFQANGSFDLELLDGSGRLFRGLHLFEDVGDQGNEYIFMPPQNDQERTTEFLDAELEVVEKSALRQRVRVTYKWKLPPEVDDTTESRPGRLLDYPIVSTLTLSKGSRFVEVETEIENRVKDHRLRVLFSTQLKTNEFVSDAPFDLVTRPFHTGEANRTQTHTMESFFAVTDQKAGLAVFSAGMPEHQVLEKDATMALTLLRCVDILGDLPPQFWDREQLVDDYTPAAQCLRSYTFRYAVFPFSGGVDKGEVRRHCERFVHRLRAFQLPRNRSEWLGERFGAPKYFEYFEDEHSMIPEPEFRVPAEMSFLAISDPQVALAAVKFRDDGQRLGSDAVVRLVNYTDEERTFSLTTGQMLRTAEPLTLIEEPAGSSLTVSDQEVKVPVGPRRIETVRLSLEPGR